MLSGQSTDLDAHACWPRPMPKSKPTLHQPSNKNMLAFEEHCTMCVRGADGVQSQAVQARRTPPQV